MPRLSHLTSGVDDSTEKDADKSLFSFIIV